MMSAADAESIPDVKTDGASPSSGGGWLCDGRQFATSEAAALHCLWLIQRLCYEDGRPADGFRFREGILAARKLLNEVNYHLPA